MGDNTYKLFDRVAKKLGWMDEGGLDAVEKKVCCVFLDFIKNNSLLETCAIPYKDTSWFVVVEYNREDSSCWLQ